jgi:hypothetical protein
MGSTYSVAEPPAKRGRPGGAPAGAERRKVAGWRYDGTMNRLLKLVICIALSIALPAGAMGLLPEDEGRAAWEALEGRILGALGGSCAAVKQPAERVSAVSVPGATRGDLAVNKVIAASLHPMQTVSFVIGPEKTQGKPRDAGGLLALTPSVAGTYVLGSVSHAWIDVVDQERNSFAKGRPYQWVDFCGRRMKAGIFDLRAGARYWIQVSASPEPVLDLFVAGPLN